MANSENADAVGTITRLIVADLKPLEMEISQERAAMFFCLFLALAEVSGSSRSTAFEAKKRPAPKSGAGEAIDEYVR